MIRVLYDWLKWFLWFWFYDTLRATKCRKTEAKYSLKPFAKDTGNSVNKSKLEANTRSWREVQENVYELALIGFGFTDFWLDEKLAQVF